MRVVVAAVLLGLAVPALAAAPALQRIEVAAEPAAVVRLHLSEPVALHVRTLPPSGEAPNRVYVDLEGVVFAPDVPHLVPGAGPVLRVRAAYFTPDTLRVVVDLAEATPFTVDFGSLSVAVAFTPGVGQPTARYDVPAPTVEPAPPPAPPAAPAPAPAPPRPVVRVPPRSALHPPLPAAVHVPVVVLDPGHGGRDPGAAGVGGVVEKDVVLALAQLVAARLAVRVPVAVRLTRTDDSFVSLERRLEASGERPAVFLSLHANACSDTSARGVEVFYGGGPQTVGATAGSPQAKLLGRCIEEALQARVGSVRGSARPGSFRVLNGNPAPSALVEIGYLTHAGDAARAQSVGYRAMVADALADGITRFLRVSAPPL
jgi:N-acetylmuramoyl-L-alanine amidase